MTLFAYWPILVLLSVPDAVILYWEAGMAEYETEEECSARLDPLEARARADDGFRKFVRALNHGEDVEIVFSRECGTKPPPLLREEILRRHSGPGERA